MPKKGIEPSNQLWWHILSVLCIPFHHFDINTARNFIIFSLDQEKEITIGGAAQSRTAVFATKLMLSTGLVCTTNKQIEQLTKAVNDMSAALTTLTMKLESEE